MKFILENNRCNLKSFVLAFSITSLFSCLSLNGQLIKTKLDVVAGISAREYVHGGLRYQYTEITQLGLYLGSDLEFQPTEDIKTYCLDHMIHFGSLNMHSNRPAWYARQGFTLSINNLGQYETKRFSYFNFSAGREFAINDWIGVNADMGFIWQMREYNKQNGVPVATPINNSRRFFSLARFQLFLSF